MRNSLYWLLNASSFIQLPNKKIFGISNMFFTMAVCACLGAIPIAMKWTYSNSFYFLIPFIVVGILFCFWEYVLGVVPKNIQDKHWRTQTVRFNDPKAALQNSLYPGNLNVRKIEVENKWEIHYGVSFEDTVAPWFQKRRIIVLPVLILLGILIGSILR